MEAGGDRGANEVPPKVQRISERPFNREIGEAEQGSGCIDHDNMVFYCVMYSMCHGYSSTVSP